MVSPYFVIRTVHAINACVFLCDPPTTFQLTPMLPSTSSSLACASALAGPTASPVPVPPSRHQVRDTWILVSRMALPPPPHRPLPRYSAVEPTSRSRPGRCVPGLLRSAAMPRAADRASHPCVATPVTSRTRPTQKSCGCHAGAACCRASSDAPRASSDAPTAGRGSADHAEV